MKITFKVADKSSFLFIETLSLPTLFSTPDPIPLLTPLSPIESEFVMVQNHAKISTMV